MHAYENLCTRRSIRNYNDQEVSDEVLEKMKELGHNVYGEIKMKTWHNENKIVIESIMY